MTRPGPPVGDNMAQLTLRIDSRLDSVALVGVTVAALCRHLRLDEMTGYQIETCLVEAVNNAILHAYRGQSGQPVDISWRKGRDGLELQVWDYGLALREPPSARQVDTEAGSGRGWFIMREWMDRVDYLSDAEGNRVVLFKRLNTTTGERA
jgi:serine/threonine-protein kinase RsbW